jgi:hypothetical protein
VGGGIMENSLFLTLKNNELLECEGGKGVDWWITIISATAEFLQGFNQGCVDGYKAAGSKK